MRVLVIQTAFLGDMILTLPLLNLLRSSGAASELAVLAAPAGARLLETQGIADAIIEFDKRHGDSGPAGTLRVSRAARAFGADAVLVPHRSFRSAAIAAMTGAPRRIGFDESGGRALLTQTVAYRVRGHEIERVASLATALGVSLPDGHIPFHILVPEDAVRRLEQRFGEQLGERGAHQSLQQPRTEAPGRLAVLAPGSRWATKRWPADRYGSLADRLASDGFTVALAGGPGDREIAADVVSSARVDVLDLSGRLDTGEWLALVDRSTVLVSNDSAAAHVAAGVGVPVVAIFGPTVPEQGFAPYADCARVVASELDCRPCGRHGADRCARGTLQCMTDIDVEKVHGEILGLLESGARRTNGL